MRFLSVCSGVEAASVAWGPLGWHAAAFAEIGKFPSAVLRHRYPDVPNWGDLTKWEDWPDADVDLLVGGTPCQSFSLAGGRGGMADERGKLALEYCLAAARYRPRWCLWENVPGALSADDGDAFESILSALARWNVRKPADGWGTFGIVEPGPVDGAYGLAWRVLDAQFVRVDEFAGAVPQRRRRVFVVGHLGDWRPSAAVLLERESLRRDPPPRRRSWKGASVAAARGARGGGPDGGRIAGAVTAEWAKGTGGPAGDECYNLVAEPIGFNARQDPVSLAGCVGPLDTDGGTQALAFSLRGRDGGAQAEVDETGAAPALRSASGGSTRPMVATEWAVRRLTPRECERLQGFPDDWTLIPMGRGWAKDGPRYAAMGNSMAVNVMRWIGRRIEMVEATRRGLQ